MLPSKNRPPLPKRLFDAFACVITAAFLAGGFLLPAVVCGSPGKPERANAELTGSVAISSPANPTPDPTPIPTASPTAMARLRAIANPTVGGTITGTGVYPVHSTQPLTAVANGGWSILSWADGDTANPRAVIVPAGGGTATAKFVRVSTISTVANPPEAGSVTGAGAYRRRTMQQVTAIANRGWKFRSWRDGKTENPRTFTVQSFNATFTAEFVPDNRPNIVLVGDSITYGWHTSYPGEGYSHWLQLPGSLPERPWITDIGYPRRTLQEMLDDTFTRQGTIPVPPKLGTLYLAGAQPNIAVLFAGTTDMAPTGLDRSAEDTWNSYAEVARRLKQQGWKVVVVTSIWRWNNNSKLIVYNQLLRSSWSQWGDAFVDPGADPKLGTGSSDAARLTCGPLANRPCFNNDLTHPTDAGSELLASYISAALAQLLTAPSPAR